MGPRLSRDVLSYLRSLGLAAPSRSVDRFMFRVSKALVSRKLNRKSGYSQSRSLCRLEGFTPGLMCGTERVVTL